MLLKPKQLKHSFIGAAIALSMGLTCQASASNEVRLHTDDLKTQLVMPEYSDNAVEAKVQARYFMTSSFMQYLSMHHYNVGKDDQELVVYPDNVRKILNIATTYAMETNAPLYYLMIMGNPDQTAINARGAELMAQFINDHDEFATPGQVLYTAYVISTEIQNLRSKYADQPKSTARKIAVKLNGYHQFLKSYDGTFNKDLSKKFKRLHKTLTTDSMLKSYSVTDVFVGQ